MSTVACVDNVNGDTQGVQVSGTGGELEPGVKFSCIADQSASGYASGHVEFDMEMQYATTVTIYVAISSAVYSSATYAISPTNLSTSNFTHVSIPVADFTPYSSNLLGAVNGLEVYYYQDNISGPVFTLCNVRWTSN